MSFASGFAAGSAAAQRGVDMGLAMQKRKEEEQYKAQMSGLAKQYQDSQDAAAAYEQQRAELEATGAPMASAVAQQNMSPEAQKMFGLGGPPPQMSVSPVSAPGAGLLAGDRAGVVMPEAPQAMTGLEMQQRAANIALGAGRTGEFLQIQGALDARKQADRQYQLTVDKYDEMNRQFETRMEEQIRSTRANEADADERTNIAKADSARLQEQTTATINNLNTRLDQFTRDNSTNEATNIGRQIFKSGVQSGKPINQILAEIESTYAGEDNSVLRLAATTAATDEYFQQNGINDVIAGRLVTKASAPITTTLNMDFKGNVAEEAKNWNSVLQGFADPDYSDGIETNLVQVKDPDTGEPTGAFKLQYGDRTLEEFDSIRKVREYAKNYQEGFANNPFQIGQYIENTKAKAAAGIARAESNAEKEKLFAGFLEANPHLLGDQNKLMQVRMELGMQSPLINWGGDGYINPGEEPVNARQAVENLRQTKAGLGKQDEGYMDEAEFILGLKDPEELEVALRSASPEVRAAMEDLTSRRESKLADYRPVGLGSVPVM